MEKSPKTNQGPSESRFEISKRFGSSHGNSMYHTGGFSTKTTPKNVKYMKSTAGKLQLTEVLVRQKPIGTKKYI